MPSKPAGAFGRRTPELPPEDAFEQMMTRPSREERMQTMWTYTTVILAILILGVGAALRFTVFAAHFEPKHSVLPVATSDDFTIPSETSSDKTALSAPPSPNVATPSPLVSPTPEATPAVLATPSPMDGEPVTPSLSETQGRLVPAK